MGKKLDSSRKLDPGFKGVSAQDARALADRAKAQGDTARAAIFKAAANRKSGKR